MVHAGVGWSGTETNVPSNRAECNNLSDICVPMGMLYLAVIVYCGVDCYSMAWCVNFH